MVEIQQLCLGQGHGGGLPHSNRLRILASRISGMRKTHGQESTDRGYPLPYPGAASPETKTRHSEHINVAQCHTLVMGLYTEVPRRACTSLI